MARKPYIIATMTAQPRVMINRSVSISLSVLFIVLEGG